MDSGSKLFWELTLPCGHWYWQTPLWIPPSSWLAPEPGPTHWKVSSSHRHPCTTRHARTYPQPPTGWHQPQDSLGNLPVIDWQDPGAPKSCNQPYQEPTPPTKKLTSVSSMLRHSHTHHLASTKTGLPWTVQPAALRHSLTYHQLAASALGKAWLTTG